MKNISEIASEISDDYLEGLGISGESMILDKIIAENAKLKRENSDLSKRNHELEEFSHLFNDAPVGCVQIDEQGMVLKANTRAQNIFGRQDLQGQNLAEMLSEESKTGYEQFLKEITDCKEICEAELEIFQNYKHKHIKVVGSYGSEEHTQSKVLLIINDETAQFEYRRRVEYLSLHDQLTGLYNRRFFDEELRRLDVERSLPIGIILADLNGLKLVNDAFGHSHGDLLLIETSKRIKQELRKEDIVARLGGDEFVVLLPNTPEEKLREIAGRIKRGCEEMDFRGMCLSISLGYSIKRNMDLAIHKVLKIAEDRMYKDKLFRQTSQRKEIINGILITLHGKSQREAEHAKRVSLLCTRMAEALEMDQVTTAKMKTAGLFHDIGKIAVDNDILYKNERFSKREHRKYQKHSEIGYRILRQSADFAEVAEIALSHHERVDGSGYPRGLKGDEISLESRILTICDAFDAMVSKRPYRKTKTREEAIAELRRNAGSQFDATLVDVFIKQIVLDIPEETCYNTLMEDTSIWDG